MGDKGVFKVQKRHGFYRGYDLSKYTRTSMSICLGKDRDWGTHLSGLLMVSYGVKGSTYFDGRMWRIWCSSARAFHDLSKYYHPDWNCHRWRVTTPIFEASNAARRMVVRGYLDADGYPNFSEARQQVSLKATSVNKEGLLSMRELLGSIGYAAGVYRRYKDDRAWELCITRQEDVVRFYSEIGFAIPRKQQNLRKMMLRKGILSQRE